MILSYHPMFVGDENRLCAGRPADETDLAAICRADAVILNQGCYRSIYDMAAAHCAHVFPDYTARFDRPGKIGQARLFAACGAPVPQTCCFEDTAAFFAACGTGPYVPPLAYPFVFKCSWSGEGANVWRIDDHAALARIIEYTAACEKSGQYGFVIQALIPAGGRSLRVAVIGGTLVSYWRIQPDPDNFRTGLAEGAEIDHTADPELQEAAKAEVFSLCRATGINLAGFDLIFDETARQKKPLFLEINYFFGRRGLGGSARFYELLIDAIHDWLAARNLAVES
ncbi:MAG: ATP-grasp domain-containing protein [Thermodesulfobacteriota bacterium]